MKTSSKLWIAFLCIIASGLSLWLTIEKLSGNISSIAGCGAASGCANVLGSKWSMVGGVIPISVFSLAIYLGILLSLRINSALFRLFRSLAAWLCIWAALWFMGLQFFILNAVCPYCMTMHAVGIALGISLLCIQKSVSTMMMVAGSCLVSCLALTQHFGPAPATHLLEKAEGIEFSGSGTSSDGKVISFFDGQKQYSINQLPHIGSVDAQNVIVKYYDYTCVACQEVHEDLAEFMEKYPDQIAVILLPVPLNHACNPHLPTGLEDHANACEFAELALRVWKTSPENFAEFHHQLFELSDIPFEAAEAMADSLIDGKTTSDADELWVKSMLKQNIEDYKTFSEKTPVMPKLLLPGSLLMQGKAKDGETFHSILLKQLDLD